MPSDIVERLREAARLAVDVIYPDVSGQMLEAADEIERLRIEVKALHETIGEIDRHRKRIHAV